MVLEFVNYIAKQKHIGNLLKNQWGPSVLPSTPSTRVFALTRPPLGLGLPHRAVVDFLESLAERSESRF